MKFSPLIWSVASALFLGSRGSCAFGSYGGSAHANTSTRSSTGRSNHIPRTRTRSTTFTTWSSYARDNHHLLCRSSATENAEHSNADTQRETPRTSSDDNSDESDQARQQHEQHEQRLSRNRAYIATLTLNLTSALRSYQFQPTNLSARRRAYNIMKQIEREAMAENAEEALATAQEMARRVGMPLEEPEDDVHTDEDDDGNEGNDYDGSGGGGVRIDSDSSRRKLEAEARRQWEAARPGGIRPAMNTAKAPTTNRLADGVSRNLGASSASGGRSILSTRQERNGGRPDLMMGSVDERLARERLEMSSDGSTRGSSSSGKSFPGNVVATGGGGGGKTRASSATTGQPFDPSAMANNLKDFGDYMASKDIEKPFSAGNSLKDAANEEGAGPSSEQVDAENDVAGLAARDDLSLSGEAQASELVARAGAGPAFVGETLGIGGLDDVLAQVKRRVWVPLAAPPSLLAELGINPVRGLLLYGLPGCGKTLLARSLGKILSPARPISVVSGPEIMDRFVGSSEANLRELFDHPPDIYDSYRVQYPDMGAALSQHALHVIVLDEFDAIARARGGGDGKGGQGDAGVARDSVVNQMLAKMDGVDPLVVPTLVIGLTNKRSLIEPALLRPGRFEVQINVPKPKTKEQRMSILKVHMNSMYNAGRVLVSDPPAGSAAARRLERKKDANILSYNELIDLLAVECDGMSGASLAAVARAAASRALERAVYDFAGHVVEDNDGANDFGEGGSIADCLVTQVDLEMAIEDVFESSRGGDGGEEEEIKEAKKKRRR